MPLNLNDERDPRNKLRKTILLGRLESVLIEEGVDQLGLPHIDELRQEVARRLRPPREVQANLFVKGTGR